MRGSHSLCNTGLRRNDGEYRWISDQGVARHDAQGGFAGYIGSCVDVTELMTKEEALHEFEERVVLAAEAAHLGVWEMDSATNELWMSDSARTLFQFDSETPLDHTAFQDRVHPEDRALRDSAVKRAIETRRWIRNRISCFVTGWNSALDRRTCTLRSRGQSQRRSAHWCFT